jgi:uncharacterized membrane protein
MTVDVASSIIIRLPRQVVADYTAEPERAPLWYVNIQGVTALDDPPLRVGSRIVFKARFLGRSLSYTYEVVELVAGTRLVMRTAQGPFPMETTYVWEDAPGGTRMTLRNRGEPAGFLRLMAPIMGLAMRRANRKDLRRLKMLLELRPSASLRVTS